MSGNALKTNSTEVFVFELASCFSKLPPGIAIEGLAMFATLMRDFSEVSSAVSFSLEDSAINSAKFYKLRFPPNVIRVSGELKELFREFCERCDFVYFVAPENDFLLYELSKIADNYGNLGSPAKAVKVTSDKWEVYRKLKGRVNMPKTSLKPFSGCIVKPRVSCGGEGISFFDFVDFVDINMDFNSNNNNNNNNFAENAIYQEYIKGIPLSVSLIAGEDISVLSLNEQILDGFVYTGTITPAKLPENVAKEVVEQAVEAVSALKLRGYCGVDVVYGDLAYVVDVNARMTTSAVLLREAYGLNIGDLLIKNYFGKAELPELKPANAELRKVRWCKNPAVAYRDWAIAISSKR